MFSNLSNVRPGTSILRHPIPTFASKLARAIATPLASTWTPCSTMQLSDRISRMNINTLNSCPLSRKTARSPSNPHPSPSDLRTSTYLLETSTSEPGMLTLELENLAFLLQKRSSESELPSKLLQSPSTEPQLSTFELNLPV